jgi:hypothetical protein
MTALPSGSLGAPSNEDGLSVTMVPSGHGAFARGRKRTSSGGCMTPVAKVCRLFA